MADKLQITPMVTPETRDLLRRTCHEKGCSQGDLVEHALRAFLCPTDEGAIGQRLTAIEAHLTMLTPVLQKLTVLEEGLVALVTLLQTSVTPQAPAVPEAKVPIATYDQMYGPVEAPPPVEAQPPPPCPTRFQRWFVREVPS